MDLVTTSKALEIIKYASPGSTLYIGLYKDAQTEESYDELAVLLGYTSGSIISDGPYKVYSESAPGSTPIEYATGWISGKYYDLFKEYPEFDYAIAIGGLREYPDLYSSKEDYATALTSNDHIKVSCVYDNDSDKFLLTANNKGITGNSITLHYEALLPNWKEEYGDIISGPTLSGGKNEITLINNGVHVWVKNTEIKLEPTPEVDPDDPDTPIEYDPLNASIHIKVCPGVPTNSVLDDKSITNFLYGIDLNRWKWDETDEIGVLPYISWGDNSSEIITDITNIKHTYENSKEYDIYIWNIHMQGIASMSSWPTDNCPISEIHLLKPQVMDSAAMCFCRLPLLTTVSGELYVSGANASMTATDRLFRSCRSLNNLDNFSLYCAKNSARMAQQFYDCWAITDDALSKFTIKNIDLEKIISIANTYKNAHNITKVNNIFYSNKVTDINNAYSGSGLKTIPAGLFDNVTNAESAFSYISDIKLEKGAGFPSLINGDDMFSGTKLSFSAIKQIYESLKQYDNNGYDRHDGNNWWAYKRFAIILGYDADEPNIIDNIRKLLNISSDEFLNADGSPRLPQWPLAEYSNTNAKGWQITFN